MTTLASSTAPCLIPSLHPGQLEPSSVTWAGPGTAWSPKWGGKDLPGPALVLKWRPVRRSGSPCLRSQGPTQTQGRGLRCWAFTLGCAHAGTPAQGLC